MKKLLLLSALLVFACNKENNTEQSISAFRVTQTISYNNISIDVVIDKPALSEVDVLLVFHGTVLYDYNDYCCNTLKFN